MKNWHREVPGRLQAARIPVISEFISTEPQSRERTGTGVGVGGYITEYPRHALESIKGQNQILSNYSKLTFSHTGFR